MSIWTKIFGVTDPKAEPLTYPSKAFGTNKSFFTTEEKDLAKFRRVYEQGGLVGEAIDTYPLFTLTNGYRLESDNETSEEMVQDFYDKIDIETCISQLIVDSLVIGKGYAEIVYNRAGNAIVGLLPRPAETFTENLDEKGNVLSYTQTVTRNSTVIKVDLKPEQIFVLDLHMPLIRRAMKDILIDAAVADGTATAIQRHGYPRYHVKIGQPGEDVPLQTLMDNGRQFEQIKPNHEWVTTKDVEVLNIDQSGVTNTAAYSDWSIQRVCTALGVPEEMLGLGRGSTEATSKVRIKCFNDKIGTIQKMVARQLDVQLVDKLTGNPGSVWTEFNDVSPADENLKADYAVKLLTANPMDPYAIVTPEWVRDYLGIEISPEQLMDMNDELNLKEEPVPEVIVDEKNVPPAP